MRIHLSRKLKQAASALLVTMVLGGILCTFVMYYLALIEQQNMLSVRSQAWNIAIAISEIVTCSPVAATTSSSRGSGLDWILEIVSSLKASLGTPPDLTWVFWTARLLFSFASPIWLRKASA